MSGSDRGGNESWRPEPRPVVQQPEKVNGEGGGAAPADPCAISETTNLNSVDRQVLATVRVGDLLTVTYLPGPPRRLVAQTIAGNTVGSITSPSMPQLIQCISAAGYAYVGEVILIQGAICQVRVRPA